MMKNKLLFWTLFMLTVLFTLGFVGVTVLGVLYDGAEFLTVFPVMAVIETQLVRYTFELIKEEP